MKNKKLIGVILSVILLVGGIASAFIYKAMFMDTEKKVLVANDKDSSLEQIRYKTILSLLNNAGVPTVFDESKKDPFLRIYATSGGEENLAFVEYDIYDKPSKQSMNYIVYNFSSEYDFAKDNGEKRTLINGLEVYVYGSGYYWYNKKDKLYSFLGSQNWDTTGEKELEKAILSIGKTKFDFMKKLDFKNDETVVVPTYTINDSKVYEMTLEYDQESENDAPGTMVILSYDKFNITQSLSYDYTESVKDLKNIKKKTINDSTLYIERGNKSVYYKKGLVSLVLQPNVESGTKIDDLVKVLKSIKF
ncbi:hypothetical protein [Viridibacillus arvi]|uniref:hypothetical protein n=1 Tax=Viridibacillus arvi TaxID=263475 RepID=UPI0034CD65D6